MEKPIIFSTPMVKAILDGRKTMTRRIVKFPKDFTGEKVFDNAPYGLKYSNSPETLQRLNCPYGVMGDRLWVREAFQRVPPNLIFYKADAENKAKTGWKPSIHMPKKAHRICLEIVNVRVEQLQNISESDSTREGVISTVELMENDSDYTGFYAIEHFQELWESIYGKESWHRNPWVWVIEFKRIS